VNGPKNERDAPPVKKLLFALALALASAGVAHAEKIPVSVDCITGYGDIVGPRLCTAFRHEIEASAIYRLENESRSLWQVHITSLKQTDEVSIQAVSWSRHGEYIGQTVFDSSRESVKGTASMILTTVNLDVQIIKIEEPEGEHRP
jgi:hypothetical protein